MQLSPDHLPNAITPELAKDFVDRVPQQNVGVPRQTDPKPISDFEGEGLHQPRSCDLSNASCRTQGAVYIVYVTVREN
jgi:hypothetical protein